MDQILRKYLSPALVEKIRKATLFRPEDPNKLLQILPPLWPHQEVTRIKGFRTPSPGSQAQASVPVRESADDIYNINYYSRDPRNLKTGDAVSLNTTKQPLLIESDKPYLPTAYKRKINLLPYDPSGLRTTKTTTWAAIQPILEKRAVAKHLPAPAWSNETESIDNERQRKGLPPAVGKPYKFKRVSDNYTVVRW
jgi:hypothetical protein